MNTLESQIFHYISESHASVSFRRLHRHFKQAHQLEPEPLKQAVRCLVQAGRLCYRTDFGTSYLDISINGTVKVSEHVFLKPLRSASVARPGQWEVVLEEGASFGRGDHPTTRLAIQLIDGLMHDGTWQKKGLTLTLDIGTGSGVLAIVAAKMGMGRVQAVDIDPCAVFEARSNIRLNDVEKQVTLINDLKEVNKGCCDLILANMRTPTLIELLPRIVDMAANDNVLIFSGMRTDEMDNLCDRYCEAGFFLMKMCSEKNWGAVFFARGGFRGDTGERISEY
jgi:ribosomal protein L11 methyltransferase